jgi:hypothetical protein
MSCSVVQVLAFGPFIVFSDKTDGDLFVVSEVMNTADVRQTRVTLQTLVLSTNGSVQLGYQLSNDKLNWYNDAATPELDKATLLGSALTTVTTVYGTTFSSIPANSNAAKLFIRFVVLCKTTSSGLVMGQVVGRVETKALS